MNIDEKDIITLSDDIKYIVVKKINYNDLFYYYIAEVENPTEVKFLYEDGNELVEIEDENHIKTLVDLMLPEVDLDDFLKSLKSRLETN